MADNDTVNKHAASWYLVQYTADLRKRESRNVGVLLEADGRWVARFFGEKEPGKVDGRRLRQLGLVKDSYAAWLGYYRRKMRENRWSDVERAQRKKATNFAASLGGKLAMESDFDPERTIERLYNELVAEPTRVQSASDQLKARAAELFAQARIDVERNVPASARLGDNDREIKLPFDFSFVNGQLHLAEAVALGGWAGEERALAFNARVKAVRAAGTATSFLALYDGDQIDSAHADVVLAALEGVAHTVDMAEGDQAVETLREIAHHD